MTIRFVRVYFARGGSPSFWAHRCEAKDPPTMGFTRVVLIPGEKRSTLLCPHTLWTGQVSNKSSEVHGAEDVEIAPERLGEMITKAWETCARLDFQREYGVAALALTELGQPVPKFIPAPPAPGEEDGRRVGGKAVVPEALRPCRRESKRGRVAEFFLQDGMQSLHEAMARLGLTRSGVLSHLFTLNRDHGVGYELASDCARLVVPDGFDLFAYVEPERAPRAERPEGSPEPRKRTGGKPVVPGALRPIPEPGKRATVARLFVDGWHSLADASAALGLDRSAVLSHLFTINKENGLGYELSPDSASARLLVPEGHVAFGPKPPRPPRTAKDPAGVA